VFQGQQLDRKMLFFEHEGNRALRIGEWKLVAKGRHGQDEVKWELFNISNERSEMHDLSAVEPERFQRMQKMWREKATAAKALPWPKSKTKKAKANSKANSKK
jgi:arylsulfatase